VERTSSAPSSRAQQNHARIGSQRITFDFGKRVTALDVGDVRGEKQKVHACVSNEFKTLCWRGRYRNLVASGTQQSFKRTA
jgi:hypothetical protein